MGQKPLQEIDNEEAQVRKLLQEYDDFGGMINYNKPHKKTGNKH